MNPGLALIDIFRLRRWITIRKTRLNRKTLLRSLISGNSTSPSCITTPKSSCIACGWWFGFRRLFISWTASCRFPLYPSRCCIWASNSWTCWIASSRSCVISFFSNTVSSNACQKFASSMSRRSNSPCKSPIWMVSRYLPLVTFANSLESHSISSCGSGLVLLLLATSPLVRLLLAPSFLGASW